MALLLIDCHAKIYVDTMQLETRDVQKTKRITDITEDTKHGRCCVPAASLLKGRAWWWCNPRYLREGRPLLLKGNNDTNKEKTTLLSTVATFTVIS